MQEFSPNLENLSFAATRLGCIICCYRNLHMYTYRFVCIYLDVLLGDYLGLQVAVKVLKDKSMVQQFLAEAYVMTYITFMFTFLLVLKDC